MATREALHNGNSDAATACLVAEVRVPACLATTHLMIHELVRDALQTIAAGDVWLFLQQTNVSEQSVAEVQSALESQEFFSAGARALTGEILFSRSAYDQFRRSLGETRVILTGIEGIVDGARAGWVRSWYWRFAWLDQAEARNLLQWDALRLQMEKAASHASLIPLQKLLDQTLPEESDQGFYNRWRYPWFDNSGTVKRAALKAGTAETSRQMQVTACALKRFQLRNGALPETLEQLQPDFLAATSWDYLAAHPLIYRRKTASTFLLYSVGRDGNDDGGAAVPDETTIDRSIWGLKDAVWPEPAGANEKQMTKPKAKE